VSPSAGRLAFTPELSTTTGSGYNYPTSVAGADLNLDGIPDVVAAFQYDNSIVQFLGLGHGTFAPAVNLGRCNSIATVMTADMNNDGLVDIVAGCADSLQWLQNSGTPGSNVTSFTLHLLLPPTGSSNGVSVMTIQDFTKDGLLDIVATNAAGTAINLYTNLGRQLFSATSLSSSQSGVSGLFSIDLDNNGLTDVVFTSSTANKLSWLQNNGNFFFPENVISTTCTGASGVAVYPFGSTALLHIVVSCAGLNSVLLYVNAGSQVFSPRVLSNSLSGASSVALIDLDQDGMMDILASATGSNQIEWFENFGSLSLLPRAVTGAATAVTSAVPYDVDGDGDLDVLSTATISIGHVAWYQNNWVPRLSVSVAAWNTPVYGMPVAGNLVTISLTEANGIATLTSPSSCMVNSQAVVGTFANLGKGLYSFTYNVTAAYRDWPWTGLALNLALHDVFGFGPVVNTNLFVGAVWTASGDAVASSASRLAYSYLGLYSPLDRLTVAPSGAVALVVSSVAVATPASVGLDLSRIGNTAQFAIFADFDADGNNDVVVFNATGAAVLYRHTPVPNTFVNPDTVRVGCTLGAVPTVPGIVSGIAVDYNGDGFIDIILFGPSGSTTVLMNNLGCSWQVATSSVFGDLTGTSYATAAVADYNGDGLLDFFMVGVNPTPCELFLSAPGFTWSKQASAKHVYPALLSTAQDATALDMNNDGLIDILVVCVGANRLFLNNATGYFTEVAASYGLDDPTTSSTGVDVGDVDLNGILDVFVTNSGSPSRLFMGNGSWYTDYAPAWGVSGSGAALFVDVDADGDLDLPGVGFLNPRVRPGVTPNVMIISPQGRTSVWNQAGSTVSLTTVANRTLLGAGVSCANCRKHQGAYDVRFTVASLTTAYDCTISFVTGVTLNAITYPGALAGLTAAAIDPQASYSFTANPIIQVPYIASLELDPMSGYLGIGDSLTVYAFAGNNETGLSFSPGVTINGNGLSQNSFSALGNGLYSFTYVVLQGSSNFLPGTLTLALSLQDNSVPFAPVSTPTVTQSLLPAGQTLAADAVSPTLYVDGLVNGSRIKSSYATLTLTCVESKPFSSNCTSYWFTVNGSAPQPANITGPMTAQFVAGPFLDGNKPLVTVGAYDAGGNPSPVIWLTWTVDLDWPVSTWAGVPPPLTNQTSVHLTFNCSKGAECAIEYTLDNEQSVWINGFGNDTTQLNNNLHTTVEMMPRAYTNKTTAQFQFFINETGQPPYAPYKDGTNSVGRMQLRLEGASSWSDGEQVPGYDISTAILTMTNLTDGTHDVEARAMIGNDEFDNNPLDIKWVVDTVPPITSFVVTPPTYSATPAATAWFVYKANEGVSWYQYRSSNTSTHWITSSDDSYMVTDFVPGTVQYFEVRAIDYAGNTGPSVVWTWSSAVCPPIVPTISLKSVAASVGRRIFVWTMNQLSVIQSTIKYGYQYRLDDGEWNYTSTTMADVWDIPTASVHSFDIMVLPVSDCMGVTVSTAVVSTNWYEYDASPGVPAFVSTPDEVTTSLYPVFTMNSTAKMAWFQYSMDGSSWQRCITPISLGPLPVGNHTMEVKTMTINGDLSAETAVYNWSIIASSDTMIVLSNLTNGPHTFEAYAVDSAGNEEPPHIFTWTVDTVPPTISAILLSPQYSNLVNVSIQLSCNNENASQVATSACLFCWSLDGSLSQSCGRNTLLVLPTVEGAHTLAVIAYDAAGNVNNSAVVLSWETDLTPPTTLLALTTYASQFVPSLSETVVLNNQVGVVVTAALGKALAGFKLYINGALNGTLSTTVANVSLPDGNVSVLIKAVDRAGNVDPVGVTSRLVIVTKPPVTSAAVSPPVLTNSTTISFTLKGTDELVGGLSGFQLALSPVTFLVPAFVAVGAGGLSTVTLNNVPPGTYTIVAQAQDVVGHVDPVGVTFVFTVDISPPTTVFVSTLPTITNNNTVAITINTTDTQSTTTTYYRWNQTGPWYIMRSTLILLNPAPEGTTFLQVRALDLAGNWEQPPYLNATFVVDTHPPVLAFTATPSSWTNNSFVQPCVSVFDTTAVVVTSTMDSLRQPVNPTSLCAPALQSQQGQHNFTFYAVDAAGNVAPPLTTYWVYDSIPPSTSTSVSGVCVTLEQKTVCPTTDGIVVQVECNPGAENSNVVAPCSVMWQLASYVNQSVVCGVSSTAAGNSGQNLSAWTVLGPGGIIQPNVPSNGRYDIYTVASDVAGNVAAPVITEYWVDVTPPGAPTLLQLIPNDTQIELFDTQTAHFEIQLANDNSPGQTTFVYNLTVGDGPYDTNVTVPEEPSPNNAMVILEKTNLQLDTAYELRVWSKSQAGLYSTTYTSFEFVILSTAPSVSVLSRPAQVSGDLYPVFQFQATWAGTAFSNIPLANVVFQVQLDSGDWLQVPGPNTNSQCDYNTTEPTCTYTSPAVTPGTHTLQVRTVLSGKECDPKAVTWEYKQCTPVIQYNYIMADGDLECLPCEAGMDCSNSSAPVAARGYWASNNSEVYYQCPISGACLGGNSSAATISECSIGYTGLLCSSCSTGYFQQYDACIPCPKSQGVSILLILAIVIALVLAGYILFRLRDVLPIVQIKVGVSMLQILASANTAYSIPWPSAFHSFLDDIKVVLVDVAGLIPANCTQTMTYYKQLVVDLVTFKAALLVIILGPWLVERLSHMQCGLSRRLRVWLARFKNPDHEEGAERDAALYGWPEEAVKVTSLRESLLNVKQSKLFRASFMFLFLCYPGITLKIFRMFKCRNVDGTSYLVADLRLQCYTAEWAGYAIYAGIMAILYAFGLPMAAFWILFRRRHKLFGLRSMETRAKWGFLYESYGSTAWWWEVEELVRKLVLSAVVVLMDQGTALQVSIAVLVSGWAHVLHATYKPWGRGSPTYMLQHISLFVTFFVFLMGLLFKVNSVGQNSPTFVGLSIIMLCMCIGFMVAWVVLMGKVVHEAYNNKRIARLIAVTKSEMDEGATDGKGGKNKDAIRAIQNPMMRRALERAEGKAVPSLQRQQPVVPTPTPGADGMLGNPMLGNPLLTRKLGGNPMLAQKLGGNPMLARKGSMAGGVGPVPGSNPLLSMSSAGPRDPAMNALLHTKSSASAKLVRNVQRQAARPKAAAEAPVVPGKKPRVLKSAVKQALPTAAINPDLLRRLEQTELPGSPSEEAAAPVAPKAAVTTRGANPLLRRTADDTAAKSAPNMAAAAAGEPDVPGSPRKLAGRGPSKLSGLKPAAQAGFGGSSATPESGARGGAGGPSPDVPVIGGSNPLAARRAAAGATRIVAKAGEEAPASPKPAHSGAAGLMIARSSAVTKMASAKGRSRSKPASKDDE